MLPASANVGVVFTATVFDVELVHGVPFNATDNDTITDVAPVFGVTLIVFEFPARV